MCQFIEMSEKKPVIKVAAFKPSFRQNKADFAFISISEFSFQIMYVKSGTLI
jgi:hypothetical protein